MWDLIVSVPDHCLFFLRLFKGRYSSMQRDDDIFRSMATFIQGHRGHNMFIKVFVFVNNKLNRISHAYSIFATQLQMLVMF